MTILSLPRLFAAGLVLAGSLGAAQAATHPPKPFQATYRVLQDGQEIGRAQVSLTADGHDQWTYRNNSQGTGGIAAMLGASSHETTHFRWNDGLPATISYDYTAQALKTKRRHLTVDADTHEVTVDDGRGPRHYAGSADMIDRNTLPYALGLALASGAKQVSFPVAVKQRVEQQHFEVNGKDAVSVPVGHFEAEKVSRSDDTGFVAWYVPSRYPLPVKLSQREGGDLTLELVSFTAH